MLPFLNMRLYNRNNYHALQPWIEKMKNNQLTVENMLEEDEIVQDLKSNQNSQFLNLLSNENIRKLIDYATKMPASDDQKIGHKFPFNATELLCCDNTIIVDRIMNELQMGDESEEEEKEEKEEEKEGEKEKNDEEEFVEVEDKTEGGKKGEEEKKDEPKKDEEAKKEDEVKKEDEAKKEEGEKKDEEAKKEDETKKEGETKKEEGEKKEEPKKEEDGKKEEEVKKEDEAKKDEEPKKEEAKKEEPKKEEEKKEEEPKKEDEAKKEEEAKKEDEVKKEEEAKKEEPKKEDEAKKDEEPKKEDEAKKDEEPKKDDEQKNDAENKKEEKAEEEGKPQKDEEEKEDEEDNSKKEERDNEDDSEREHDGKVTTIYDNVDYLLRFLNEKEETKSNYVLVGYFYRILSHLITSQQTKIVQYFFDYPKKNEFDILDLFVKNMNRKSMGEIINKLLLFNEDTYGDFVQKKMELFSRILEELKGAKEQLKYECICSTLEACFYNKAFVIEFMKDAKYIELLYTILEESKDLPKKAIAVMKLLIKINETTILKNIESRCTTVLEQENPMDIINMFSNNYTSAEDITKDPDADMEQLTKNMITYLFNALEKNKFNFMDDFDSYSEQENCEFNTTYQIPQKKIGMKKLSQIELFRTILDILVNAHAKCNLEEQSEKIIGVIKELKIFDKINKIFFDFPFCNLYQAIYIQILDIVLNESSPKLLIETVFDGKDANNLIQVLIDKALGNMKFEFKSNRIAFHPNFSIEVTILSKIFLSTNEHLKYLIKDNKNLEVFHNVIGDEVNKVFDQKLLLSDNEVQINSQSDDEKKTLTFFGKKNFMELLEEDLDIYKIYLNGGDYLKTLNEKKEKERKEREDMERQKLEEEKKLEEEENYFDDEEEDNNNKKDNLKSSINLDQDEDEDNNEKNNENEEKEKENEGEGEKEEKEKSNEEDNKYNETNYWKPEIKPSDDIMNSVLNDLD